MGGWTLIAAMQLVFGLTIVFAAFDPKDCLKKKLEEEKMIGGHIEAGKLPGTVVRLYYGDKKVGANKDVDIIKATVNTKPKLIWITKDQPAPDDKKLVLIMVDVDAMNVEADTPKYGVHWIVKDIPTTGIGLDDELKISGGDLAPYVPPAVLNHKYLVLLYVQSEPPPPPDPNPDPQEFLSLSPTLKNGKFTIKDYAEHWKLGTPIAGTFFWKGKN